MLLLTPVATHYLEPMSRLANNAPPSLTVDAMEYEDVLNNLMTRTEYHFLGGFRQNRSNHTAESQEQGMNMIIRIAMHKDAKSFIMRDGYIVVVRTEIEDMVVTEATKEEYDVVD